MKNLLIIFLKNPILGKVKTRLGKELREKNTLVIYEELIKHTLNESYITECDKSIYFTDYIENDGIFSSWENKRLQQGKDLGERMHNAFKESLSIGYENIVLIGCDIYDLNSSIIEEAFIYLFNHDIVIGPSLDGGYYLIGMKNLYPELFTNKDWGSDKVLESTLRNCKELGICYKKLDILNDIDNYSDLKNHKSLLKLIE